MRTVHKCMFSGTREEVVPRGANRARIEGQTRTRSAKAKDEESEDESEESVQIVERTT
jgi:hypothetical protein